MIPQSIRRTDSRLVRQALRGRRDSFNRLVERHMSGVYAVALARTQNHADAEDVVQEAFINAYTGLDKLREPASFGGWVATIARNAAVRLCSKRNRENDGLDAEPESAVTPDPSRAELQELLRTKLSILDEDAREVLLLHYFAGYSAREIADRLEISRDAALKRLQRSREKLAASMLETLEGSLDVHRPGVHKQVRRVTTLVAAMAVPWSVQKAAAGGLGKLTFFAAGAGAAAVAAGVWWIQGEQEPVSSPQSRSAIAEASPAKATIEPSTIEAAPADPNPLPVVETPVSAAFTDAGQRQSLNGLWTLHQPKEAMDGQPRSDWPASATVELTERGREVLMTAIATPSNDVRQSLGTLNDGAIAFPILDLVTIMWGGRPSAGQQALNPMAVGTFEPGAARIRLKGLLPDVIADGSLPPEPFHITMNRLDEDAASLERKVQRLVTETHTVRDAILAYAYDHRGQLPNTLRDLVPQYLDGLDIVSDNDERTIAYDSDAVDLMTAVQSMGALEQFQPGLSMRERLMLWEAERTAVYGDRFPDPADLLRVRVGQTAVSIRVGFHGEPEIRDPNRPLLGQPNVEVDDAERARIESGECMNHIKHAGLGIALFWNETEGAFTPAGWRSLVPEFLEDPTVLRCPRDEPGTLSYEMLFPATSRAELEAIYASVNGVEAAQHELGNIPVAYEPNPHIVDGQELRTVLYLDGHVEMMDPAGWTRFVEPYLRYAIR